MKMVGENNMENERLCKQKRWSRKKSGDERKENVIREKESEKMKVKRKNFRRKKENAKEKECHSSPNSRHIFINSYQ